MALPSSKPAGSDFPPKNDHHQRGTPQEGEPAATFMFVAYAAAKRGPPVGRIRTAAIPGGAPRAEPTALRRETPCLCLARRSAHRPLPGRRGLSRCTYGLRQTRRLSPRGRGPHSHGTARLVRREGLQVFTPSSSDIPHDSCPDAPAQGGPAARPPPSRLRRFTYPFGRMAAPAIFLICSKHIRIPNKNSRNRRKQPTLFGVP